MVQLVGWNDVDSGFAEGMKDILVIRICDDGGMTDVILLSLVYPQVNGSHIQVLYFLPLDFVGLMMKMYHVGSSAEEGITGIHGSTNLYFARNCWSGPLVSTSCFHSHSQMTFLFIYLFFYLI